MTNESHLAKKNQTYHCHHQEELILFRQTMLVRGTNEGCLMTLYLVRQTWLLRGTNEGCLMTLYPVRQTWLLRGTYEGYLMTLYLVSLATKDGQ